MVTFSDYGWDLVLIHKSGRRGAEAKNIKTHTQKKGKLPWPRGEVVSLQRASGKGAPYRGWASNPKLVLLPQLLAEGESRLVRFKINGHMANMALLTASWDSFAGGALLGSLRFRVQVICLPTCNPSLIFWKPISVGPI